MRVGAFVVAADHPALPGHFPSRPVVPGVMLLDRALQAVLAGGVAAGLPSVKFLRPVAPGETVEVFRGEMTGERVAFACRVGAEEAVRGVVLRGIS